MMGEINSQIWIVILDKLLEFGCNPVPLMRVSKLFESIIRDESFRRNVMKKICPSYYPFQQESHCDIIEMYKAFHYPYIKLLLLVSKSHTNKSIELLDRIARTNEDVQKLWVLERCNVSAVMSRLTSQVEITSMMLREFTDEIRLEIESQFSENDFLQSLDVRATLLPDTQKADITIWLDGDPSLEIHTRRAYGRGRPARFFKKYEASVEGLYSLDRDPEDPLQKYHVLCWIYLLVCKRYPKDIDVIDLSLGAFLRCQLQKQDSYDDIQNSTIEEITGGMNLLFSQSHEQTSDSYEGSDTDEQGSDTDEMVSDTDEMVQ